MARSGTWGSFSPTYGNIETCPARCSDSGANTGNWSVFANLNQLRHCQQAMFYDFSLYDPVDDPTINHRIHACASFGPDFSKIPASGAPVPPSSPVDVHFEVGWWQEGFGLAAPGLRSLIRQIRKYVDRGHGDTDAPFVMFGQSGQATIGVYIGQGLLNQGISKSPLAILQDNLENLNVSAPSLAMQLCGPKYGSTHAFGVMVTSNGTFGPIQDAIRAWENATCLSFAGSTSFSGQAMLTTPLLQINLNGTTDPSRLNTTIHSRGALRARATCRTVQVQSGDGCAELAARCGISGADFTKLHPGSFCSTLKPKQHVCCTSGDLPDFRPKPSQDGSCYSYQVKRNDNCANLAAEYGLTIEQIVSFNKNTWGWSGCTVLLFDAIICLSSGSPPFPGEIFNAECGPQKRGSKPPTDGSDIAAMNPCPLNACCNIWGQCGVTEDYCIDTNTGAPGTAAPDSYGCISNCGLGLVKGDGTGAIKIGYFEGYNLERSCLYQDAAQIDTTRYTHIHFAFAVLTENFEVSLGDTLSTYQFGEFKKLTGAKRILSFGGWTFSTHPDPEVGSSHPDTFHIFRNSVKPENRLKTAINIANFIKEHDLDGVDIDWEYPGAHDLPGIDPGEPDEGCNYLLLLVTLKNALPGKSVSISAPASYWYLKQYPISDIARIVDYIVFMSYDLHGQWDATSIWAQVGCITGNCLRSQVNLTETVQSLVMITKAGVPGRKVVVGVTSYGRSFDMVQPGCWGPNCFFTGDRLTSNAKKGVCTGTAGYLADAEIAEIMQDPGRIVTSYLDSSSHSNILVYDNNQWVGYMDSATKKTRTALYAGWGLGGTTDWATSLQVYHPVPRPADSWASYKMIASGGGNPKALPRNSSWTDLTCMAPETVYREYYTPSDRWHALHADDAWRDVVRQWQEVDSPSGISSLNFIKSATQTLHIQPANCGWVDDCGCDEFRPCPAGAENKTGGPAAELIYESLMKIHTMHHDYHTALFQAMAVISPALDDMEDTFAPIPQPKDDTWTLLLINLLTLGTLSVAAPLFNSELRKLPYFMGRPNTFDSAKDLTLTVVGQSTTIAKDLLPDKNSDWTTEGQNKFSHFMGTVVSGWANVTAMSLKKLFNGEPESLDILWSSMSDGKLVTGMSGGGSSSSNDYNSDLRAHITKTFFGFAIPHLWRYSRSYAFVMDSGLGCNEDKGPMREYIDDSVMKKTGACIDGRQYYLVYPADEACDDLVCGEKNKFSPPPGLDALGGITWGGIQTADLIKGSVRTWLQNGKKNGGALADPDNVVTAEDLLKVDVTTPGFIRLPVCSPERAFQSWDTAEPGSSANFPCDIPPGRNFCGISTFVGQTSDASPASRDCLQIIRNIENDGSTQWEVSTAGLSQRAIATAGSCRFGVEATANQGNAVFWVGGQDVRDIITDAVKKFGGSGKVSGYGELECNGNLGHQKVKWGIY
ncbi:hypothetical protein F5144DRAFT_660933 [Chaetomium tenue]|uniref:Uncharacterized protein n=1 Tax=Chaetomium tenue TaxID=1854479 RepID=A0ACB7NVQ2_9PEZI|nr:hypothetical protein F5144DRAFT_660933 [Chaetomium globosum]